MLVLASASPARLRTLRAAGLDPEVIVSGVDESIVEASSPQALCATLARLKAEAVAARLRHRASGNTSAILVLGCDSMLEFDGEIFGKPDDEAQAVARWRRMRGSTGMLHTGHCLVRVNDDLAAAEVGSTTVRFADVTDEEIAAYVSTGEPQQVAGGFTIDGLGGWFVESIDGDPGTVVGVSLPLVRRLLSRIGVTIDSLWPAPLTSRA